MAMRDGPMVPGVGVVLGRREETPDTVTLEIGAVPGRPSGWARPPAPGEFAMLATFGSGEVPISVSRVGLDPEGSPQVHHTIRAVGSVTAGLHALEPGALVGVRGPYGVGWDVAAAAGRDVVVAAGGIGLAPLRPVIDAVLADGVDAERRRLVILVGARTPADLCFADELATWAALPGVEVRLTVDRLVGPGADEWTDQVGVVTSLVPRAAFDPARSVAYVCGPEVMMRFTVRELAERGVPIAAIQVSGERSMTCGVGHCGHCQLGPVLICRDGPVMAAERLLELTAVRAR